MAGAAIRQHRTFLSCHKVLSGQCCSRSFPYYWNKTKQNITYSDLQEACSFWQNGQRSLLWWGTTWAKAFLSISSRGNNMQKKKVLGLFTKQSEASLAAVEWTVGAKVRDLVFVNSLTSVPMTFPGSSSSIHCGSWLFFKLAGHACLLGMLSSKNPCDYLASSPTFFRLQFTYTFSKKPSVATLSKILLLSPNILHCNFAAL